MDQYVAEKDIILFAAFERTKEPIGYLKLSPKSRRQNNVLKQLVEMLGSSVPLYNTLCQFLRTLFLRTHISHYCSLRADLIMLLHEQVNIIIIITYMHVVTHKPIYEGWPPKGACDLNKLFIILFFLIF